MSNIKLFLESSYRKIAIFYISLKKTFNEDPEKGAIPLLVWGVIALVTAIGGYYGVKSQIGSATANFLAGMFIWVGNLFIAVSRFLCQTGASIFDDSLVWLSKPITKGTAFVKPWGDVRDFSNMFIVLGFVVVGIATSLRIREYEAKKLLMPLIITALLINFTGLFCGLIIDASNLTATSLISDGGITSADSDMKKLGAEYVSMVDTFSNTSLKKSPATGAEGDAGVNQNVSYLSATVAIGFVYLMVAATFLYMGIIFMIRYGALAFLYILSPLAFVCKVFPLQATQKIWNSWCENFLKWSFIGVGGSFALWVSSKLMTSLAEKTDLSVSGLATVLIFLVVGFKITTNVAPGVSSAIMGAASGGMGFLAGAIAGGSKLAGGGLKALDNRLTGGKISSAGRNMSSTVGRTMENFGLKAKGTSAGEAGKDLKETSSRIENMSKDSQTRLAQGKGMQGFASAGDRTAAIMNKVKTGNLSDLGSTEDQKKHIAYAESYLNSKGLDASSLKKDAMKQNPNIGTSAELKKSVAAQAPKEFTKNIDAGSFTPAVVGAMDNAQMTHLTSPAAPAAKREAFRNSVKGPGSMAAASTHAATLSDPTERMEFIRKFTAARAMV